MKDKYGDYGTIAAALVLKDTIDSFILSCRAFGKSAEITFASFILIHLKAHGVKQIKAEFIPSGRNNMTKYFYRSIGFTLTESSPAGKLWTIDLQNEILNGPDWITIT